MRKTDCSIFLTGVTGFVGGALALELLMTSDAELTCLVRARPGESASARLQAALHLSAKAYGVALTDSHIRRCRAVPGDITEPTGGVDPTDLANVTEFWHAAASLAFEDQRAAEITLHNEVGTKHVVDLALKAGCGVFNHISTAYVAGMRQGSIPETHVPEGTTPNNQYERSKIASERIAQTAGFDITRTFRPSIVIGHSQTYGATTFSGFYGFVRGLLKARDTVRSSLGDLLRYRPLRLLVDGETPVNFIPIDYVARSAVKLAEMTQTSAVYHLANSSPPRLADCWESATDVLEIMRPLFVDDESEFTTIDQRVHEEMTFFRPYLNDFKRFEVTNVENVLGRDTLRHPLSSDEMAKYARWYLDEREERHRSRKSA